tara:strand:- start:17211 stop:18146 length:936 start_codon:yes stop_codon:yes gene_type:complete
MNLFTFSIFFIIFLLSPIIYKLLWLKIKKTTPTGYGFIFIIIIIMSIFVPSTYYYENVELNITYLLILLFSFIYWFDDFKYLPVYFRFFLQFISGFVICIFLLEFESIFRLLSFAVLAGFLNIFLSNIFNFYDGEDLNICLLLMLVFSSIFFKFQADQNYQMLSAIIIIFLSCFALFNFKPNSIYLGDSGCFMFSLILISFFISNINSKFEDIIFVIFPVLLPAIDVIYVILLRVLLKENLTTRNYHHLYQMISLKYGNFFYLSPQVINSFVIYILYFYFSKFYQVSFNVTLIIIMTYTFISYLIFRKYLT